ncbi:hypothetical protein L9F63_028023, partial [Diploptera punctata]
KILLHYLMSSKRRMSRTSHPHNYLKGIVPFSSHSVFQLTPRVSVDIVGAKRILHIILSV